jgi:hypothetical protein
MRWHWPSYDDHVRFPRFFPFLQRLFFPRFLITHTLNTLLHLSKLSDQLDVTLES